jgi:hypothetical protein
MPRIPITGESLRTFFDVGDDNWALTRWLVADGETIGGATSIAMLESDRTRCEFECFEDGVLLHSAAVGDKIELQYPFAVVEVSDSYWRAYQERRTLRDIIAVDSANK